MRAPTVYRETDGGVYRKPAGQCPEPAQRAEFRKIRGQGRVHRRRLSNQDPECAGTRLRGVGLEPLEAKLASLSAASPSGANRLRTSLSSPVSPCQRC